jgi:regulator of sirC expression with transglutaminase-like and TPR domain
LVARIGFDEWFRTGTRELDRAAGGPTLEIGAALVARDAHPDLDVRSVLSSLDELAAPLLARRLHLEPTEVAAAAIAHHLYGVHGFRGNEDDYSDPRNSYIDDVLQRRLGIPITLAVVLVSVARRASVSAHGISFPGHFLVRFERPHGGPLVVDPFHGGRAMNSAELTRLLQHTGGPKASLQLKHLEAATTRATLVRVLTNLKNALMGRGDLPRALVAATRIATLMPGEPWPVRDRGMLQAQLGAHAGARDDLLRYLELAPSAADAARIRELLSRLPRENRSAN